jgi:alkylation response protein AidB-like acyl-CoA dehydrogenase
MVVGVKAARLLCWSAARLRESGSPDAGMESCVAKYFASTVLRRVVRDAVRMHGANGCSEERPLERHLRDATIMEVIEGTTDIHEVLIGSHEWHDPLEEETA